MSKIRIVADDKIPFLKGVLEEVAHVSYLPGAKIKADDVRNADALLLRTRTLCDRKLLEGSSVRFIATATIGYDHIDVDYCKEAGISWTNAPGCNAFSVEQYLVSSLLYLAVEKGLKLEKSTLGIVGVGNVGSKVARAAEVLGLKVLFNDPPRQRREGGKDFVSLDRILEEADIISLHVPLNREGEDATWHLVDRTFLARARQGLVLVNTSRGSVVESEALLEALEDGKVVHGILDVFEKEPEIPWTLQKKLSLATPHIAGYSLDGKAGGTIHVVQALSSCFNLGLDDWIPLNVPVPDPKLLLADASGDPLKLLWEVYSQCYDVRSDHRRLLDNPDKFEKLRGDYPFRREARAYTVKLFNGYVEIRQQLEDLGFSVLVDSCM